MSRRDKKRREQERRKAQQQRHKAQRQRQRKPLSSQSQAPDNDRRGAYTVEHYTRILHPVDRPKAVVGLTVATALILGLLAALPSLPADWPVLRLPAVRHLLGRLHAVKVDTDPENMLSPDAPVRLFPPRMEKKFPPHDMNAGGWLNDEAPGGG